MGEKNFGKSVRMNTESHFKLLLTNEQQTIDLGVAISRILLSGDCVALRGSLGSGKTTLVRGILRGLGMKGVSASPTFNILHTYPTEPPLFHIDAYRFKYPAEFFEAGLDDCLGDEGICVIEWAGKVEEYLPLDRIEIRMHHNENGRSAEIWFIGAAFGERSGIEFPG